MELYRITSLCCEVGDYTDYNKDDFRSELKKPPGPPYRGNFYKPPSQSQPQLRKKKKKKAPIPDFPPPPLVYAPVVPEKSLLTFGKSDYAEPEPVPPMIGPKEEPFTYWDIDKPPPPPSRSSSEKLSIAGASGQPPLRKGPKTQLIRSEPEQEQEPLGGGSIQQPLGGGPVQQTLGGGLGQQPLGTGFAQQPLGGGFVQQPFGGGFGQQPFVGGFGQQPLVGGFGQQPLVGGFGQQPFVGGFGQQPFGGGFGQQPFGGGFGQQPLGSALPQPQFGAQYWTPSYRDPPAQLVPADLNVSNYSSALDFQPQYGGGTSAGWNQQLGYDQEGGSLIKDTPGMTDMQQGWPDQEQEFKTFWKGLFRLISGSPSRTKNQRRADRRRRSSVRSPEQESRLADQGLSSERTSQKDTSDKKRTETVESWWSPSTPQNPSMRVIQKTTYLTPEEYKERKRKEREERYLGKFQLQL